MPMDAADTVIAKLEPLLLPRRVARLREVLAARSDHAAFVFERMTDPHNLSAVLRSLDAFGFQDAHWIAPDPAVLVVPRASARPELPIPPASARPELPIPPASARPELPIPRASARTEQLIPPASARKMGLSHAITRGTDRWLTLIQHADTATCFAALRARGYRILASDVTPGSPPLDTLDLDERTAFVFGNEHGGVTPETLALCDGRFHIAMHGFTESLNLSVACGITAFHCRRAISRALARGSSGTDRALARGSSETDRALARGTSGTVQLAATAGDPRRYALPPGRAKDLYVEWLKHSVRRADEVLEE